MIYLILLLAQDDPIKGWKHRWADAKPGSWVKFRSSGKFMGQDLKSEFVHKVVEIEGPDVTIEYGEGEDTNEMVVHVGLPGEYKGKASKTGEEELTVAGKKYKCAVWTLDLGMKQTTKLWKCADAPVWAVKEVWTADKDLGWTVDWLGEESVKVGEKDLKCQVFRKTVETMGISDAETEWRHPDVPGQVAKRTKVTKMGGKEQSSTTEVAIAFEKK
jgi:hypothetical protein